MYSSTPLTSCSVSFKNSPSLLIRSTSSLKGAARVVARLNSGSGYDCGRSEMGAATWLPAPPGPPGTSTCSPRAAQKDEAHSTSSSSVRGGMRGTRTGPDADDIVSSASIVCRLAREKAGGGADAARVRMAEGVGKANENAGGTEEEVREASAVCSDVLVKRRSRKCVQRRKIAMVRRPSSDSYVL